MASQSSVLARRILRTEESGGLQSLALQRVRHLESFPNRSPQKQQARPPSEDRTQPPRTRG